MPLGQRRREQVGVVHHREVVAVLNDDPFVIGESACVALLEAEWIVALPEDGQHRQMVERTAAGGGDSVGEVWFETGRAHRQVESASHGSIAVRPEKRLPSSSIEMTAGPESGGGHTRHQVCGDVDCCQRGAGHDPQHGAQARAVGRPGERVGKYQPAETRWSLARGRQPDRTAQVRGPARVGWRTVGVRDLFQRMRDRGASRDPSGYLQEQLDHLAGIDDSAVLTQLRELGTFYGGMNAMDKAVSDIRIHGRRYLAMVDLLDELKLGNGPLSVLEIGCNTGFLSLFVKQRHPQHRVVAVDRAPVQIKANQLIGATYEHPVEWVALEGASVTGQLGAGTFDVVYLCEILEHLEHDSEVQHEVLRESLAAIRDTGVVVVTVPYEDRIPSPGHLTEFTRDMLRELLESEAEHVVDLDPARAHYGLEKHFIFLAGHQPIAPKRFASAVS